MPLEGDPRRDAETRGSGTSTRCAGYEKHKRGWQVAELEIDEFGGTYGPPPAEGPSTRALHLIYCPVAHSGRVLALMPAGHWPTGTFRTAFSAEGQGQGRRARAERRGREGAEGGAREQVCAKFSSRPSCVGNR
jgi:hypothetical protein